MMNIINRIVEYEWEMFQRLTPTQRTLACRNNKYMFLLMRSSQWKVYPLNVQASYLNDIHQAFLENRNLLFERYAYMMILTRDFIEDEVTKILPVIEKEKEDLVDKIIKHHKVWYESVANKLPTATSAGRPMVYGGVGDIDVFTYLKGELFTYSINTLINILEAEKMMISQNKNLVIEIYKNYTKYNHEVESRWAQ